VAYVAMPQQRALGKVGGEPPRPVRLRPRVATSTVFEASGANAASEAAVVSDMLPMSLTAFAEEPEAHCKETVAESADANDVLMFTAQPADGIFIQSSVFELLRRGASERCAAHRYSTLALES